MIERFERFSTAVFVLNRYIQKIEADEMVKYGLKGSYAQYLIVINRFSGGITASQLCRICDKNKAAVSRALAEMEEKGVIVRKGESDNPYRARLILTDNGKQIAQYVTQQAGKAEQLAGKGLDEEHRKIFYESLDLFAENLRLIAEKGIPQD